MDCPIAISNMENLDNSIKTLFHELENLDICKNIDYIKDNTDILNIKTEKYKKISFINNEFGSYHGFDVIERKLCGNGLILNSQGFFFDGYLKNNLPDGYGRFELPDNSYYIGEWKLGLPNGKGIWEDKKYKYNGNWLNGKKHGFGEILDNEKSHMVRFHHDELIEKKTPCEIILETTVDQVTKRNNVVEKQLQNKNHEIKKYKKEIDLIKKTKKKESEESDNLSRLNTELVKANKKLEFSKNDLLNKLENKEKIIFDYKEETRNLKIKFSKLENEFKEFSKLKMTYHNLINNNSNCDNNLLQLDDKFQKQSGDFYQLQYQLNETVVNITKNDSNIDALATELTRINTEANKFDGIIKEFEEKSEYYKQYIDKYNNLETEYKKINENYFGLETEYKKINENYIGLDYEYQDILSKYIELTEKDSEKNDQKNNDKNNIDNELIIYENEKLKKNCKDLQIKLETIEKKTKTLQDNSYCIVCQSTLKNVVLLPCRHFCLCTTCENKNRAVTRATKCPVCRLAYNEKLVLFR
jgi:hypothetical protein